jgi:hypothetical protein
VANTSVILTFCGVVGNEPVTGWLLAITLLMGKAGTDKGPCEGVEIIGAVFLFEFVFIE